MTIGSSSVVRVVAAALLAIAGTAATAQDAPPPSSGITPPAFDILHVGGAGDVVLVGTAEPGATIELLEGTDVIARADANGLGEWIIAPEGLAPGPHNLTVRTTSADGRFQILSPETVAVEIPPGPRAASVPESPAQPVGPAFTIADFAITIEASAGAGALVEGAIGYPQLAIVRPGDSPWRLAERYYGDGTLYRLILDANRDAIRRAGTLLAGMTVLIPDPAAH